MTINNDALSNDGVMMGSPILKNPFPQVPENLIYWNGFCYWAY